MTLMAEVWTWLMTPLSGSAGHAPPVWAYWHARFMVAAWTVLLPAGMLVARYLKVTPRQNWPERLDNKAWWRTHVWMQSAGVGAMTAGLSFAYGNAHGLTEVARWHELLGWTVIGIAAVQVAGGIVRGTKGGPTDRQMRGDHYDMTLRRVVFEYVHKHLGWCAVPPAIIATGLGLYMLDAPRWMPIAIAIWWLGYALLAIAMQWAGWCIDTYQAIWGSDPIHPGLARRPIGRGIMRR